MIRNNAVPRKNASVVHRTSKALDGTFARTTGCASSGDTHQNFCDHFTSACGLPPDSLPSPSSSSPDSPARSPSCLKPDLHPASGKPLRAHHLLSEPWMQGPADPAGKLINLSDRPSLCMSVHGLEAAIGSSDHAVYIVNVRTGEFRKALYGKGYGHTDWVTCVDHLPDGRVLSGGMDSKLCLWERRGVRCVDLTGHSGSISALHVKNGGLMAVSSSYDKSLMLWDLSRRSKNAVCSLQGHRAAVMDFALGSKDGLVSGCRDGAVILWDSATGSAVLHCKNAHSGHVTAVECTSCEASDDHTSGTTAELFLTGGQDGVLQVWDFRIKAPVCSLILHSSSKDQGAVSCIKVSRISACGCPLIVTAGADKIMKVLDPRRSFQVLHTLKDHRDFIYSLHVSGSLAWSGGGDGSLLAHDLIGGKCLYGLGASRNGAVRCIGITHPKLDNLICCGDDGYALVYTLT